MKHVFKTVMKFAKAVASKGYAKAMAEADEQAKHDLKLDRIYNNRKGAGRRSFFTMRLRWRSVWSGNGKYLRPEYQERARRRGERYFRHRPFTMDAPTHIQEKCQL